MAAFALAIPALLAVFSACMLPIPLGGGEGHPWGMAFDSAGNLWFAEAGCEPPSFCADDPEPGQIGFLAAGTFEPRFYTLPAIPENHPLFVAVAPDGAVWFTTPLNARIGRFDPVTQTFEQWPVTSGSGPWQLAFGGDGAIWYTERFASAIGRFDPVTRTHRDFQTPTRGSEPYGLATRGNKVWFTENQTGVGRIGVLDIGANNKFTEYTIRANPSPDLTPHMIAVDDAGIVWWTEGFEGHIGKLVPNQASPGECGSNSGTCDGVTEYDIPKSACGRRHGSGIVIRPGAGEVWFTDSLSGEVGRLRVATGKFQMFRLRSCDAHAHDGMAVDSLGRIWWAEEFSNELVRFAPPP